MNTPLEHTAERSSAEKRALLAQLLQKKGRGLKSFPLSFAQQRLWFLDQLAPGPMYNIPVAMRLTGTAYVDALERAFTEIVRRHEALRTRFPSTGGQPRQVVDPEVPAELFQQEDLQALPAHERENTLRRRLQEEAVRPFDLSSGPLLRVHLWRLAEGEQALLVNLHRIVADGWSLGVLLRELTALYQAFAAGQDSPLPELSIQYADYAVWQRNRLQGETLQKQWRYWQERLQGAAVLELPGDYPRPAALSGRGAVRRFKLSQPLSAALTRLSRGQDVSLFMLLLAAWQVLMSRYTRQDDVVVGASIANRTRPEVEGLIGDFANTLVLRGDLSGNPPFATLLEQTRQRALEAYEHQDVQWQLHELQQLLKRDLSQAPLVQVMFILQNAPLGELSLGDLALESLELETNTSKFDLTLDMRERDGVLLGRLEYSTDLFESATMERLLGHWRVLLEAIVADPRQRIGELPLLTEAERRQLLEEWNDTRAEYPRDRCVHQLFEEQVRRTPSATAVEFEGRQLTYAALNAWANQLAHHLRGLGVGPEVLVGICVERSLELVVGLLAILKAGGAYVPLDPDYPAERLAIMLDDAQVGVLLTQERLLERLPERQHRVCLDPFSAPPATLVLGRARWVMRQAADAGCATGAAPAWQSPIAAGCAAGVGIEQVMADHSQVVMLVGQAGVGVATPLLLDGQIAGAVPVPVRSLGVEQGALLLPGRRAQHGITMPVQACHVAGREGATIGDHQAVGRRRQVVAE